MMRKLLAALLVLPFLGGANAGSAVPASHVTGGIEALSSTPFTAQPSLPGHAAASAAAMPPALEPVGPHSWRTAPRTQRTLAGRQPARSNMRETRTLIATLQRSSLAFLHDLVRARSNEPATFGNPPPVAQT